MSANGNDELEPDRLGGTDPGLPAEDLMRGFFHAEVEAVDSVDCGVPETDLGDLFWIGDPLRRSPTAVLGLPLELTLALIGGK